MTGAKREGRAVLWAGWRSKGMVVVRRGLIESDASPVQSMQRMQWQWQGRAGQGKMARTHWGGAARFDCLTLS